MSGNTNSQSPSTLTASISLSETPTLMLALVIFPASRLLLMKSKTSGCQSFEDQHQRAAPGAALLDQAGDEAVERAPRDRAARPPVDALDVCLARAQAGNVDAHAAAARHDLGHLAQRLDDPAARISRGGHDVAVVVGQCLIRPRSGQNAPGGNELEVVQQPAETLCPFLLKFRRDLDGRDALRRRDPSSAPDRFPAAYRRFPDRA